MERFSNVSVRNESACSWDGPLKTIVFPLLYSLLFVLGLSLNALAAWVFLRIPSKSHFIIYLKNMVVADLLMTFTFPFKILSDTNLAPAGVRVFVCRVSSVLFYLTMYISVIFFALISVDRCRKTLWPLAGTNRRRLLLRKLLSGLIWMALLALSLPNVILTSRTHASARFRCSDLKTPAGLRWHELVNHVCQVIFWATLLTVMLCYGLISRELYRSYSRTGSQPRRTRVQANVFLVLAVFSVCFVPFHFARVPYTISQTRGQMFSCEQKLLFLRLKESTLWLSSLNAALDPLIHFFLCRSFRSSLLQALRVSPGRCLILRDTGSDTGHSQT